MARFVEEITTVFGSLSRLWAIVVEGISTIADLDADISLMTSSGDAQNMGKARIFLMALSAAA